MFKQLQADKTSTLRSIRLALLLYTENGLTAQEVVASVEAATSQAVQSTGIEARLILCTLRFFSGAQGLETVRLVEYFYEIYVAGFDIAADQPGIVFDNHIAAFQYARENGISYTPTSPCFYGDS